MVGFGTALEEAAQLVTAAGVPCVTNTQDLQIPGAWVEVASNETAPILFDTIGAQEYDLAVTVYLVAPNNGMQEGMDSLAEMFGKVRAPLDAREARPALVSLVNHGGDMPALIINTTFHISEDS